MELEERSDLSFEARCRARRCRSHTGIRRADRRPCSCYDGRPSSRSRCLWTSIQRCARDRWLGSFRTLSLHSFNISNTWNPPDGTANLFELAFVLHLYGHLDDSPIVPMLIVGPGFQTADI